jgi:hypothetical protein
MHMLHCLPSQGPIAHGKTELTLQSLFNLYPLKTRVIILRICSFTGWRALGQEISCAKGFRWFRSSTRQQMSLSASLRPYIVSRRLCSVPLRVPIPNQYRRSVGTIPDNSSFFAKVCLIVYVRLA